MQTTRMDVREFKNLLVKDIYLNQLNYVQVGKLTIDLANLILDYRQIDRFYVAQ